jgi:formate dehydrogenase subunit beta
MVYNELLRDCVRKLLVEKVVDQVIGYARGTLPLRSTPCFVRNEQDADRLIFDETCSTNLATYLCRDRRMGEGRVGIVAKGCDGRSIVGHIVEGQLRREDIFIIGVPCQGVVDTRKIESKAGRRVDGFSLDGETMVINAAGGSEVRVPRADVLADPCLVCRYPIPTVYDTLVGEEKLVPSVEDTFEEIDSFEGKRADERWQYFEMEVAKCIRCYACRNACPLCYCDDCIVDRSNPQWFGKSTDLSDTMMFHLVRIMHTAGRCVDCGACTRVCPTGVNLRLLRRRVEREVQERFGHTAGLSTDALPCLEAYSENDADEFIL